MGLNWRVKEVCNGLCKKSEPDKDKCIGKCVATKKELMDHIQDIIEDTEVNKDKRLGRLSERGLNEWYKNIELNECDLLSRLSDNELNEWYKNIEPKLPQKFKSLLHELNSPFNELDFDVKYEFCTSVISEMNNIHDRDELLNAVNDAFPEKIDDKKRLVKRSILNEAYDITSSDRNTQYGPPEDSFSRIAIMWTAYLNDKKGVKTLISVTPTDVAHMMILLKMCREQNSSKRDNLVDIAGYARCAAIIKGYEE
jgi:hypothetical protein